MADITVNIPSPTLQGSEKFKIRYRELPSGTFTAYADKTTNTFILTGLSAGSYELECIFVTEDSVECPATLHYFEVAPDFICWDFQTEQIEINELYYIKLNFSGGVQPPCGWDITITPIGGSPQTYSYPTLPPSNTINIAISQNVIHTVEVVADLCNGKDKECYTVNTTPVPTPPTCTGAVLNDVSATPFVFQGQPRGLFIDFQQSNPATTNVNVTWQQVGTPLNQGQPLDSGSFIQAGYIFGGTLQNATMLEPVLYPVRVRGYYVYNIRFLDRCGNWLTTQITFE